MFSLTGFMSMLGVPIMMGVAMGTVARGLISHGDLVLQEEVTPEVRTHAASKVWT
jgi:hypothetical protein